MIDLFSDPGMVRGWQPFLNAKVMDVGANVGLWTAYCALHGANVTAYEADPVTFKKLQNLIFENHLSVKAINSAIWKHDGRCAFRGFTSGENHNGALAHISCPDNGLFRPIESVPCVSLGAAIGDASWDCIKMDIEGAEFETIINTPDELLQQAKFIYVEIHPWWVDASLPRHLIDKLQPIFYVDEHSDYLCLSRK
jgi:FkbM family methyltransferase